MTIPIKLAPQKLDDDDQPYYPIMSSGAAIGRYYPGGWSIIWRGDITHALKTAVRERFGPKAADRLEVEYD